MLAIKDDEKAWVTGTGLVDSREYLTVRTVAGDVLREGLSYAEIGRVVGVTKQWVWAIKHGVNR
jgi:hypothetical protein